MIISLWSTYVLYKELIYYKLYFINYQLKLKFVNFLNLSSVYSKFICNFSTSVIISKNLMMTG